MKRESLSQSFIPFCTRLSANVTLFYYSFDPDIFRKFQPPPVFYFCNHIQIFHAFLFITQMDFQSIVVFII